MKEYKEEVKKELTEAEVNVYDSCSTELKKACNCDCHDYTKFWTSWL